MSSNEDAAVVIPEGISNGDDVNVKDDLAKPEADSDSDLVSVPVERLIKKTESEEERILDELNDVIANSDEPLTQFRSRPPTTSNRQSVLAAARLQRTKNMLNIFENMAKNSTTTSLGPKPEIRKPRGLRQEQINKFAEKPSEASEDNRSIPKPMLRTKFISEAMKARSMDETKGDDCASNDGVSNFQEGANSRIIAPEVKRITSPQNPNPIADLVALINQGDGESREHVRKLLDNELVAAIIADEMLSRDDFLTRIKMAAREKGIDLSELSFALLSD